MYELEFTSVCPSELPARIFQRGWARMRASSQRKEGRSKQIARVIFIFSDAWWQAWHRRTNLQSRKYEMETSYQFWWTQIQMRNRILTLSRLRIGNLYSFEWVNKLPHCSLRLIMRIILIIPLDFPWDFRTILIRKFQIFFFITNFFLCHSKFLLMQIFLMLPQADSFLWISGLSGVDHARLWFLVSRSLLLSLKVRGLLPSTMLTLIQILRANSASCLSQLWSFLRMVNLLRNGLVFKTMQSSSQHLKNMLNT